MKLKLFQKRIFSALAVAVLCSVFVFPSFDSHAMTQVGNKPIGQSNIFTRIEGNVAETLMFELSDEKALTLSDSNLETGNYYLILFYNVQKTVNESWALTPLSDKQQVFSTLNFKYGGQVYPLANNISSFVIQGQYSRFGSLEYNANVIISPVHPGDGYVYENSVQIDYMITGEVRTYKLETTEVAEAKQLSQIIDILLQQNNYSAAILNDITKIMSSNVRIESQLSDLYDLLQEVYSQSESDSQKMEDFKGESAMQGNQLNSLNQQNQVNKIDINNASTSVDSNIDLNAVGSSGVVLSALTSQNKILTMLLGVTAVSLIAYVFFGKR